jgi:hypothetical protein
MDDLGLEVTLFVELAVDFGTDSLSLGLDVLLLGLDVLHLVVGLAFRGSVFVLIPLIEHLLEVVNLLLEILELVDFVGGGGLDVIRSHSLLILLEVGVDVGDWVIGLVGEEGGDQVDHDLLGLGVDDVLLH